MLRSNSKSLGNHVVSPEEEKERLQWEEYAEKEGRFKPGMKECIWKGKREGGKKKEKVKKQERNGNSK